MANLRRVLVILMVLVLIMTGCKARVEPSDSESESEPSSSVDSGISTSSTPMPPLDNTKPVSSILKDYLDDVAAKYELNSDTVGWLWVPGTTIEDVVLQRQGNIAEVWDYYLRRNFEKQYDFNGVYYADSRAVIGDSDGMGVNTCIYGHAMTDKSNLANYKIKFGPLHDFRDPDFAREHPYIFFSSAEENMAFEVIAVFVANADNTALPYNNNSESGAAFVKMVKEQVLPRSKYHYDVELDENDKFLTLSTCIYTLDNGKATGYPNTYYRYAIMARLVGPDEPIKDKAEFTLNDDVVYDPDGKWKS